MWEEGGGEEEQGRLSSQKGFAPSLFLNQRNFLSETGL